MDLRQAAQAALASMDQMLQNGEWYCAQERADALRTALAEHDRPPVTSGYFKVVDGPREPTLQWDGPAEQAQDLIPPEDLLVCGQMGAHVTRVRAEQSDPRQCTCHPDDNPPRPCPRQYALDECRRAAEQAQPVAMRYDFDGYGYKYIDSGSGSDWQTRVEDSEPLYSHPPTKPVRLTDEEVKELVRERFVTGTAMQRGDDWLFRSGGTPQNVWGRDLVWLVRAVEAALLRKMGVSDE